GRGGPGGGHRRFRPFSTFQETEAGAGLPFPVQRLQTQAQIHRPPGWPRRHVSAVQETAQVPGGSNEKVVTRSGRGALPHFLDFEGVRCNWVSSAPSSATCRSKAFSLWPLTRDLLVSRSCAGHPAALTGAMPASRTSMSTTSPKSRRPASASWLLTAASAFPGWV